MDTLKEMLSDLDKALLLLSSCIYKAVIYTFVLWLPILIDSIGAKEHSAYISIIFNASSIFGAPIIGKLYQKTSSGTSYSFLQYVNCFLAFLLIVGLVILTQLKEYSFFTYSIILFVEGFITGGIFNIITSN